MLEERETRIQTLVLCWDNEVTSKQFLWLPDYRSESTYNNKASRYLGDEKIPGAIFNKTFKRFGYINVQWYEVKLVKWEIEHKEPIIVEFCPAKCKIENTRALLQVFDKYCDVEKFKDLEMDTDSLYPVFFPIMTCMIVSDQQWNKSGTLYEVQTVRKLFSQINNNFFARSFGKKHRKNDKRELGLFKKEFSCTEMICLCCKSYCFNDSLSNKFKFSNQRLE